MTEPDDDGHEQQHIWRTLGYRRLAWEQGRTSIAWAATAEYSFPSRSGSIVQGGMVTALLDAAMGGACWSVLEDDEAFVTADLRVEFLRPTRPGELVATGTVVRRGRRAVFCAAELRDAADAVLATSRCTQIVLPADGSVGRAGPPDAQDGPPRDARG
jgi:uncharacterized protein (TIGR00369 family)